MSGVDGRLRPGVVATPSGSESNNMTETERRSDESVARPEASRNGRNPEELPSFQFYPRDLLSNRKVAAMTLAELGLHIKLLCYQWTDGPLPNDPGLIARLSGVPVEEFNLLWPMVSHCYEESADAATIFNPRMERERRSHLGYLQRCAKGGRRSAEVRRAKSGTAQPNPRSNFETTSTFTSEVTAEVTPNTSSLCPLSSGLPLSTEARNGAVAPPSPSANGHLFPEPAVPDKKPRKAPTGPQAEFLAWFKTAWLKYRGGEYQPATKDYVSIAKLWKLSHESQDELMRRSYAMLESEDAFYLKAASVTLLLGNWNQLGALAASEGIVIR